MTHSKEQIHRAAVIIIKAELDLGRLAGGYRNDVLLDNMPELKGSKEAAELREEVEALGKTNGALLHSILAAVIDRSPTSHDTGSQS